MKLNIAALFILMNIVLFTSCEKSNDDDNNNEKTKTENKTNTVTNNTDNIPKGDYIYYTVKSGDNFYTISKK